MPPSVTALIVEDEKKASEALEDLLEMVCPDVEVIATSDSVSKAIDDISTHTPDLVFLDIQLGEQKSFEILEELPKELFQVIFVTAYNEYAVEAFSFSAIDYLLKPVNPERLKVAVEKALVRIDEGKAIETLDVLLDNLKSEKRPKKIVLSTMEFVHVVDIENIIKCQSSANYTIFHLKSGKEIMISKTLKEYEEQLNGYGFFRVHKSWLINVDYVKGYDRKDGGFAIMNDGSEVPVSPTKKEDLMILLKQSS